MNSKIVIISGTDRPGSNALKVSEYVAEQYRALDVDAGIVDLQDFPIEHVIGGKYGMDIPEVKAFNENVMQADGLVFVVPEYNGGFPGILKMFIDYLPFPDAFANVPICFIGEAAGSFGALRPVEQLQMIAAYRNAFVFPERVFITQVNDNFDPETGPKHQLQNDLMKQQVKNFVRFVDQLQCMREKTQNL